jgi:hypothetical protein|nr:hypothetical protein [Aeromicrobium sp.]
MTVPDALQAWLLLEHEAVWLFPVIGARRDDLVDPATVSFEAHRDTRDGLLARLQQLGVEPSAAELTYATGPLTTTAEARAAAQSLEARITAACLTLVGEAEGDLREHAVRNVRKAALAEQTWGAEPMAFPGLP